MVPAATYHARRWRTLFEPQALNFTSSAPRQAAAAPVYSAAPTGIHCGLPKAARAVRNPRAAVLLLPMVAAATGIVVFMEKRLDQSRGSLEQDLKPQKLQQPSPEEARRIAMLDAYGDRSSLQALDEVMKIYEATK